MRESWGRGGGGSGTGRWYLPAVSQVDEGRRRTSWPWAAEGHRRRRLLSASTRDIPPAFSSASAGGAASGLGAGAGAAAFGGGTRATVGDGIGSGESACTSPCLRPISLPRSPFGFSSEGSELFSMRNRQLPASHLELV
jgi:hypothetical protein